jgi:hypothetical protein
MAFGASSSAKPISRGSLACSKTHTPKPVWRSATAAASPPMPAPTINASDALLDTASSLPS